MLIDLKKTLDNSKRNITKALLKRVTARTWQTIQNYYLGVTEVRQDFSDLAVKVFEENGDEVFYLK